jgi:hypothetical protein
VTADNGATLFETQRSGFYMIGSGDDQKCIIGKDMSINSQHDTAIKFGVDAQYGCTVQMTLSQYTTFCLEQGWKNLKLFNFPLNLQYLGTFGNAQINYSNV